MNDHFAIYYTNNVFYSVNDAIDIRIMEVLSHKNMAIIEISNALSKSPSTITTHLKVLREKGLLKSKTCEKDSRAKIYSLSNCEMVAESDPEFIGADTLRNTVNAVVTKDMPLIEGIFKMFIYGMDSNSIDVVPSVNILARRIGSIIASRSPEDDFYMLLMNIKEFISRVGIGEMSFALSDCVTVNILNPRIKDDGDSYLTKEFCINLIRSALEYVSGKQMNGEDSERNGDYLTLRFFFTEP